MARARLPGLDRQLAPGSTPRRFVRDVLVHTPGIELIAESKLTLADEDYLADHVIDDLYVLPAMVTLEAMSQAARALAGDESDRALSIADARFDRAVVIPSDGMRAIAGILPESHVVKALNCMSCHWLAQLGLPNLNTAVAVTVPVAGDCTWAKRSVSQTLEVAGFDVVDAGPLSSSRWIESLARILMHLEVADGADTASAGFQLVRLAPAALTGTGHLARPAVNGRTNSSGM